MRNAVTDANNDISNERIEVLRNKEIIVSTYLQALHNAKKWDYFAETKSLPLVPLAIESLEEALIDAKKRGIKLRFITEITKDNISYCKDTMKIAELKHLEGVQGNFVVSDTEYIATNATGVESDAITIPYAIYSNVKEDIKQQHYVFEILWNRAMPAEQKIREIEEGIVHYDTRIINDSQQIIKEIHRLIADSNELYSCLTAGGIEYSYNYFFEAKKKLLDRQKKGEHKGIKAITVIDESNMKLAKILLDAGIQITHVRNLPPISFALSDKEIAVTIEKIEAGRLAQSLLLSNEPAYVSHFLSIFEELWKNGINAVDRIKDIEAGAGLADIEVIPSSSRARELYLELVKNANKEILFIFPSSNAFIRQEKMGAIPLAIEAAKERAVMVRVLVPYNEEVERRVKPKVEEELVRRPIYNADIDVRYTEQTSGTMATILVLDRKASLVVELRDNSKSTFDEAIGLSTYSNSRAGVLSYVAIFENLWMLTELYKQVKEANERLTLHDKMQQEFINVAAHELRTPIQPILTMTGLLHSKKGHVSSQQMDDSLEMIHRNAQRLKRLAEDILDVTKIETQSLILNKERLNLNEIVQSTIKDVKNQIQDRVGEAQILYESKVNDTIFIEADRYRVAQLVTNLLSNALKFVKRYDGLVTISIEKKEDVIGGSRQEVALVTIKDNGAGIDADIFPRLFEKFASKSFKGTGLGLFICRSIVEAHGGRIWAENNTEKGATFHFTLPIVQHK
ncbi:MAG: HAMP domain-containing sensor histidine kinase [Candidatus Nitrosopolaris sp.]